MAARRSGARRAAAALAALAAALLAAAPAAAAPAFRLGAAVATTPGSASAIDQDIRLGYEYWAAQVAAAGGIALEADASGAPLTVGGAPVRFGVDLTIRDDQGSATVHDAVRDELLKGSAGTPAVDFWLGGQTQFGEADGAAGSAAKRVAALCCTGPDAAYAAGRPYMFGVQTPSDAYPSQVMRAAALSARVATVATIGRADVLFTNSTCASAEALARTLGLAVELSQRYPSSSAGNPAVFDAFAAEAKAKNIDMVVGCTLDADGYQLLGALQRARFPPRALWVTVAPAQAQVVAAAGALAAEYAIAPVQWHPGMPGLSDPLFGTAAEYAAGYAKFAVGAPGGGNATAPSYIAASASAAAYSVQLAIAAAWRGCALTAKGAADAQALLYSADTASVFSCPGAPANQTGYDRVLAALRALDADTFFGQVKMNAAQRNAGGRRYGTAQVLPLEGGAGRIAAAVNYSDGLALRLVLPSDAADADLVLPAPNRFRERCPPGTVLGVGDLSTRCTPCPPGFFRGPKDAERCERCDLVSYSGVAGAVACTPCPANSRTADRASTSISQCLCAPGYYRPRDDPAADCEACPEGAVCEGGAAPPFPEPGYWTDVGNPSAVGLVYRCNPLSSCEGGPNSTCKSGYAGRLCASCAGDHYDLFGTCAECPAGGAGTVWLIMLAVLVLWFALNLIVAQTIGVFDHLVLFFQLLSIVGSINVSWTSTLENLFGVANLFAFETDVVTPTCSLSWWSYRDNLWVQLVLPLLNLVFYAILHGARVLIWRRRTAKLEAEARAAGWDGALPDAGGAGAGGKDSPPALPGKGAGAEPAEGDWGGRVAAARAARAAALARSVNQAVNGTGSFVALMYIAIAQRSLGAFSCTDVAGTSVLEASPGDTECGTGKYTATVILGAIGLVVYVAGAPIFFAWKLAGFVSRRALDAPVVQTRWGWMYNSFTARHCWWGLAELAERAAMIAVVTLVSQNFVQALCAIIFSEVMLLGLARLRPYASTRYTLLSGALTAAVLLTAVGGIGFDMDTSGDIRTGIEVFVLLVVCATCAAFAVGLSYEGWALVQGLRAKRRTRAAAAARGLGPAAAARVRGLHGVLAPSYEFDLLLGDKGGAGGAPSPNVEAFVDLAQALGPFTAPDGGHSYMSLSDAALFWRRVVRSFPEVIDFLAVTDPEHHAVFVRFVTILFREFSAKYGGALTLHNLVDERHRAAVAHFLATADEAELTAWSATVRAALAATEGDAAVSLYARRVETAGAVVNAPPSAARVSPSGRRSVRFLSGRVSSVARSMSGSRRSGEIAEDGGAPTPFGRAPISTSRASSLAAPAAAAAAAAADEDVGL